MGAVRSKVDGIHVAKTGLREELRLPKCRLFPILGERGGVPDVLSVLQHRQADGALLVGVELLVIQAHLQVLGYSLQRHFNYCRLSCGGGVVLVGSGVGTRWDRRRLMGNQRQTQLLLLTRGALNDPALNSE